MVLKFDFHRSNSSAFFFLSRLNEGEVNAEKKREVHCKSEKNGKYQIAMVLKSVITSGRSFSIGGSVSNGWGAGNTGW